MDVSCKLFMFELNISLELILVVEASSRGYHYLFSGWK